MGKGEGGRRAFPALSRRIDKFVLQTILTFHTDTWRALISVSSRNLNRRGCIPRELVPSFALLCAG